MSRARSLCCALLAVSAAVGCSGTPEKVRGGATGGAGLPADTLTSRVALGDIAGGSPNTLTMEIRNPYEGSVAAAEAGHQLFIQMNCVGCHGYDARGGMGPDLTDAYWRYGGAPVEIYNSIYDGRPQGMPAWGRMVRQADVWKIVTYLQSLGGSFPASLAEAGREGNLGDKDTTAGATLKGRQSDQ